MIAAILDTNVLIQSAIGSPRGAACRALQANDAGKYQLVFSPATVDELLDVLLVPRLRARHGWSDDQVLRFLTTLLADAAVHPGRQPVPASITRDASDAKFLSLAAQSEADYLVTQDRRHLLRLRRYERTRIVTPHKFLRTLDRSA